MLWTTRSNMELQKTPVWEINLYIGDDVYKFLTLQTQSYYDEFDNYQEKQPDGYIYTKKVEPWT